MLDIEIHGGKGGEKKPHTPVETPNNLLSVAYAKVLVAVAEGELAGQPTDQDIFLDGTPLANPDGSKNFGGVKWEWRPGTVDQDHISGLPEVSTEYNVGLELRAGFPWTRTITKPELSAVRITFQWPALLEQMQNGDTVGVSMDYAVEVSTAGGPFVEYQRYNINGKTNSSYERTHRIDLPASTSGWIIRAVRITPNSEAGTIQDTVNIKSYTEVVDVKQRYPNTALLYVEFDSRAFGAGSIPRISVRTKGRIIRIPDNYDPETRTYTGIWSGAFKQGWSDNPAWVYQDIITNDRFGLGNKVNLNQIDKFAMYEIAQYCDVMVSDGRGGTGMQPRHTCNIYIQERREAWQVLRDIASIFNGMTYWNGNQFTAVADKEESTTNAPIFSRSNVVNGRFDYSAADDKSIYTSALVSYDDPDNHYQTEVESTFDTEQILRWGGNRQTEISAIGCTSRGEAQRRGKYVIVTNMFNRTVKFRTGLQGLDDEVLPGKLIQVADPLISGRAFTGRTVAYAGRVMTLDREITGQGGDIMYVMRADGTSEGRTVDAVVGNVVTLQNPFSEAPTPNAVWYIEYADLKSQLFRVTKITQPEPSVFEIEGVEYNESKYANIDNGARLEPRPISVTPPNIQAAPSPVTISSYTYVEQTLAVTTMVISWPQVPNAVGYEVQWRNINGDWINLGNTGSLQAEVKGIYTGDYIARVRAINAYDIRSVWTTSQLTNIVGKAGAPASLVNLTVDPLVFGMRVNWEFPEGVEDTARTEIMYGASPSFVNSTKLGDYAYPTDQVELNGLRSGLRLFFWGRLVDRTGNIGPWFPLETEQGVMGFTSTDVSEYEAYFDKMIKESSLDQELKVKIDKIDLIDPLVVDVADLIDKVTIIETDVNWIESQLAATEAQLKNDIESVNSNLGESLKLLDTDVESIRDDVSDLNNTVIELQGNIDSFVDALLYDPTRSYLKGDAVRLDNKLYQAIIAVPAGISPPNTNYWKDVGEVVAAYDGLAYQVNVNKTTIEQQGTTIAAQASQITGLGVRLGTAETGVAGNTSAINSLTTTVTQQGNTITTQGQAITSLNSSVTDINAGLATNTSAIESLRTTVTQQGQDIQTQSQAITSLQGNVESLQNGLNGVQSTVSAQGSAIQGLTVTVGQQGNTLSSHTSAINVLESGLATVQDTVGGLQTTVTAQGSAISNLQTTVTSQGNTLTVVTQDITSLKAESNLARTDINGLKTTSAAQGTAISNLQTTVNRHDGEISVISTSVTKLTADLQFSELDQLYQGDETDAQIADALVTSRANATATAALTATVTNIEGVITAQGQSLTQLTAMVENIGDVSGIGNELSGLGEAIFKLQTSVTQQGQEITSQGVSVTQLTNSVNAVTDDVQAAQQAAQDALTTAGVKGEVIYGSSAPAVDKRLPQNLWIDTTGGANTPKRWVNNDWTAVTDKVATDAAAAAQSALTQLAGKADASALQALSNTVNAQDGRITANANSITELTTEVHFRELEELYQGDETDAQISDSLRIATGAARAAEQLTSEVTQIGNVLTAQAERITQLDASLSSFDGNIVAQGSAIENLRTTVTSQGQQITSQSTAITKLTNSIDGKADASAVASLTSRVSTVEGNVSSQGQNIVTLNNSLVVTNNNVTSAQQSATNAATAAQTAQNAANAANTLAGGKGEVIYGSTTPTVAQRLPQNLWIDTTNNNNTPKRWNGTIWAAVTDKIAIDAASAAAAALEQVSTKAEAAALTALTNTVTAQDGRINANSNNITELTTEVHFRELEELYQGDETDAQISDAFRISNANASAIQSLSSDVTQVGDEIVAQGKLVTELTASLTNVQDQVIASGSAVEVLRTTVTAQGENIRSQGIAVTQLQNRVVDAETGISANAGTISQVTTDVSNLDGRLTTQANRIDGIYVQVNPDLAGTEEGFAGNSTAMAGVWSEASARIEDGVSTAQRIDRVQSSFENDISSVLATVQEEVTTRASADSALATQINTVQASLNSTNVSVQQTTSALAALDGKASATWGVKLAVNQFGQYTAAGFGIGLENGPAGLQSLFLVNADTFAISPGNSSTVSVPFIVSGGQVFIRDAVIQDASITNAKIGNFIMSNNYVSGSTGWALNKNGYFEINGNVPGQGRVSITNQLIQVFDPNGVLRVRMGIWG